METRSKGNPPAADRIRLLYADEALVVCDKPVGLSSESPGLPDRIREQEGFAVFPVHRLDRTTGGVCVLARTPVPFPISCTMISGRTRPL